MNSYISQRRLGAVYLPGSMFLDKANQTIGTPIVGSDMVQKIENRRKVTSRLTDAGKMALIQVKARFRKDYNVDVALRWDIHAGCSGCPCSPGFVIKVPTCSLYQIGRSKLREEEQFSIWVGEDGSLDFREPKWLPVQRVQPELVGLA